MICAMCDSKKKLKPVVKSVKYDVSGLDNILIRGVKVYHCENCGEEYTQFGDIEKIDKAIADSLLQKEKPLTGKEIRFLRTWKGYSGKRFAELIKVSSEHLYRSEGSKKPVNDRLDRIVRLAIMSMNTDRDYELHDKLADNKGLKKFKKIELVPKGKRYNVSYAM